MNWNELQALSLKFGFHSRVKTVERINSLNVSNKNSTPPAKKQQQLAVNSPKSAYSGGSIPTALIPTGISRIQQPTQPIRASCKSNFCSSFKRSPFQWIITYSNEIKWFPITSDSIRFQQNCSRLDHVPSNWAWSDLMKHFEYRSALIKSNRIQSASVRHRVTPCLTDEAESNRIRSNFLSSQFELTLIGNGIESDLDWFQLV